MSCRQPCPTDGDGGKTKDHFRLENLEAPFPVVGAIAH